MNKVVIILLGPPGSGKGSQSVFLKDKYSLAHISTGEMLREEIAAKTDLGIKIKSLIDGGKLLDDTTMTDLLVERLSKPDCERGFIIDGYPRNLHQVELLNSILNRLNLNDNIYALEFNITDDIILKRILGRYSCANCGEIYNKYFKPTKVSNICDKCSHSDFVFRKDDNEEVLKARLKEYHNNITPMLSYYEEKKCKFTLDASLGFEEISNEITKIIK